MEQGILHAFLSCVLALLLGGSSYRVAANVRGPPRVTAAFVDHFKKIPLGRGVKLLCPVEGNPPPLTMWTKDGETIHKGWERFRVRQDGLRIEDTVLEDSGNYLCRATNGFGTVHINYTLTVVEEPFEKPPKNRQRPSKTPADPGALPKFTQPAKMHVKTLVRPMKSTVRLMCKATGKPKPQIIWEKNGRTLTDEDFEEEDLPKRVWVLKLKNVDAEDSGEYTCIVVNKHGSINATYSLEVVEPVQRKPELQGEHPVNTSVEYGGTTSFQCRVKSDVQPHIKWLKRVEPHNAYLYKNASLDMDGQKYAVLPSVEIWLRPDGMYMNKLVIPHATEEDSGMYICLGANMQGYSFRSAFLTVVPHQQGEVDPTKSPQITSRGISWQVKLALIITLPLAAAILFIIVVVICTCNTKRPQVNQNRKNLEGINSTAKEYSHRDCKPQLMHLSHNHHFTRTNGSIPHLASDLERGVALGSHSQLPSNTYYTSQDNVGRYVDMPFNPPSVYSDGTLNSYRSVPTGFQPSLMNQQHLVTC